MNKILKLVCNTIFLGVFIALHILLRIIKGEPSWTNTVVNLALMITGVLFVTNIVTLILSAFKPKANRNKTLITIFKSLINYTAFLVILCWGLTILGVNVGTIVASVGILALVVGFGAESLIADVITGLFMIFENQYNVGDIVEIDGFRGTVTEIGIRTTCITDTGNNVRIINNSLIKNLTNKSDHESVAITYFTIPYETDIEEMEKKIPEMMTTIYNNNSQIMVAEPIYLGVQELGASGIDLCFKVEVAEGDIFAARRALNHDLLIEFRKLSIECPYTQITLHGNVR